MLSTTSARAAIASSEAGSATSAAITSGALTPSSPSTRSTLPGSRPATAHPKPFEAARSLRWEATSLPVMPVAPKTTTETSAAIGLGRRGAGRALRLAEPLAAGGAGAGRLVDALDHVARVGDAGE